MIESPHAKHRLAGICLLFAALAFTAGAAYSPWLHLISVQAELAAPAAGDEPERNPPQSGHHGQDCALCHTASEALLVGVGWTELFAPVGQQRSEVASRSPYSPPARLHRLARGPPHA